MYYTGVRISGPPLFAPPPIGRSGMLRAAARRLSTAAALDLHAYRRDGFGVPSWRLPPERLRAAQAALDTLLEENPHAQPEQLVSAHLASTSSKSGAVRGQAAFLELASMPEIAELAAACLGTEHVLLWACQIFCKPAGTGKSRVRVGVRIRA